jgi:hypothetical protein
MLSWIIQITIVSFILIFLVHHLINFLKSTLTVPKIKDLVNSPNQKYENMYKIIQNNSLSNMNSPSSYTLIDLLPTKQDEPVSMKNELKNFLKKQMQGSSSSSLDTISSGQSYTNY